MKKMLFLLCILINTSCSVYTIADVGLFNDDGKKINEWENAIVGKDGAGCLKNGGINFTTNNGETLYISGGIIILKNVRKETYSHFYIQDTSYNIYGY